ncbi:MAG: adenosylcobinamide-GDP ribazoletransferase [Candidatus Accumulibacter sp.]|jgi:adenosylcobinamide-GDP ribazoletransferase|nr:adenosylcobinamide-GDP ribazoletransferase [Accumulibacter sp.]
MSQASQLETFLGALRFFTRLPVPGTLGQDSAALEKAMRYYPAVGLIVGMCAAAAFAFTALFWPKTLAVLAALVTAILVTGALHEDGWSDMIDGFGGGADREGILAIMRDSRIGNFGAVGLVLILLTRFCALLEVAETRMLLVPVALVAGHAASRLCSAGVFHWLDYARPEGKAAPFGKLGQSDLIFAAIMGLLPVLLLSPAQSIPALLFAAGASFWLWRLFKRRLGGYTGDCLGAVQQLAEVAFYGGLLCGSF